MNGSRSSRCLHGIKVVAFSFAIGLSAAATADAKVFPRLVQDTSLNGATATADERFVVTWGSDNVARLWDFRTKELVRTFRPPLKGGGRDERVFSAAFTPSGDKLFLVGSWQSVAMFDVATGKLLQFHDLAGDNMDALAVSKDGRRVAVGDNNGQLTVLSSTDLTKLWSNADCNDQMHGVDFDSAGRVVTTCFDGKVRLYSPSGVRLAEQPARAGKHVFTIQFSPDGERVALGYLDSPVVSVHSGRDLRHLHDAAKGPIENSSQWHVGWSRDGQALASGGHSRSGQTSHITVYPDKGAGSPSTAHAGSGFLTSLQFLANGNLLFSSSLGEWGVASIRHDERVLVKPVGIGNYPAAGLRLSRDGMSVQVEPTSHAGHRFRFDIGQRALSLDAQLDPALTAARTTGLPVTDWTTHNPKFKGAPIEMPGGRFERSAALDIAADGTGFALGTLYSVYHFDALARERWHHNLTAVRAVRLSEDGRFLVAGAGDGSLRWFDVKTGKERLALYVDPATRRWVLFTPEGFYDASVGGDSLIGYQLSQGPRTEDAFVDATQLSTYFFRPDLITRRMHGDEASIEAALKSVGDVHSVLSQGLPPTIALLSPAEAVSPNGEYELRLQVTPPAPGARVGNLRIFVNGAEINSRAPSPPGGGVVTQRLTLSPGTNVVSFSVARHDGKVASNELRAVVHVANPTPAPTLHVLAVGISKYDDASFEKGVKFASADAQAFVTQISRGAQGFYKEVKTVLLKTRSETSLKRIDDELGALAARTKPEDVVVIFLAGHGKAPNGDYHFLPADFIYDNEDAFKGGRTLSHTRLAAVLRSLGAGKRLLILDTCDSGSLLESRDGALEQKDAIARLMKSTGRYILAAASPQGKALEDGVGGHGVYTSALIEGLAGAADPSNTGVIEVDALANYVAERVPQITARVGYQQRPMRSAQGQNFPIIKRTGVQK